VVAGEAAVSPLLLRTSRPLPRPDRSNVLASLAFGALDARAETELRAAGIVDPELRQAFLTCRRINAASGRTFYLSTLLLPPGKRPYVHALYGFARYADDLVDDLAARADVAERAAALQRWAAAFPDGNPGEQDPTGRQVMSAVRHTMQRWDLPRDYFEAFLRSMRMDLTVTEYATWDDLLTYTYGSAAVIGLQMLPILQPTRTVAARYAEDLGVAFQLANFLRDVGEDLRRGRIYLPMDSLQLFGLTRGDLETGVVDGRVRRLLAHEIARCRELFRSARPGIRLLHPTSQPCIETAYALYGGILDEIEHADYQIFDRRVAVGWPRRLGVALPQLARARSARRRLPPS
jgi:phytoene synthase